MIKTTDEIYNDMRAVFEERAGFQINDGCDMAVRMYAAASEINSLYVYSEWVKKQSFPQTAEGEYLDYHAQMRGIARIPAVKAEGTIRFLLPQEAAAEKVIEKGTVCVNSAGDRFVTVEDAVIAPGETYGDAKAEAEVPGLGGNTAAGTVIYMTAPPVGVSGCTNPLRFSGGEDEESDELLRERVVNSFTKLPNGANKAFYEQQVMEIDGVGAVTVIPKARGVCTVDVIVSSLLGVPDDELIEKIEEKLNEKREICVDIAVKRPGVITADIDVLLKIKNGYNFETVKTEIETALNNHFDGKLLGQDILKVKLGDIIYGVQGVENYDILLPENDIVTGTENLPVLGSVTISEWS